MCDRFGLLRVGFDGTLISTEHQIPASQEPVGLSPLGVQIPPSAPDLRKASICWPFSRFGDEKLTDG